MRLLTMVLGMVLGVAASAAAQSAIDPLEPNGPLAPAIELVCDALGCVERCPATAFPATGQTVSHVAGDDGDLEAGATLAYTDNGDGTVTDDNTGLMWEKKTALDQVTSPTDLHDADNRYPWTGSCVVLGGQCSTDIDCSTGDCEAFDTAGTGHTIFSWIEALNAAKFAGHDDWRLPNLKELHGIVDYGKTTDLAARPPLIAAAFGATAAGDHWSSTAVQPAVEEGDGSEAYKTELLFGRFSSGYWIEDGYVRAVRDATAAAPTADPLGSAFELVCTTLGCDDFCAELPATGQTTSHFAGDDGDVEAGATLSYRDNGDGTVTDENTGLTWEKKTARDGVASATDLHDADNLYPWIGSCLGMGGACGSAADCVTPICSASDGQGTDHTIFSWVAALNAAKFAGHEDWRIPNLKELASIVDYGKNVDFADFTPMIDPTFGPTAAGFDVHWSSTAVQESSGTAPRAWGVSFFNGTPGVGEWVDALPVRAVRGGL